MKTFFLIIHFCFVLGWNGFSQTATNFTTNDCNLVSHDLFSELDAGKVVVMTWVMPCGTCIAPAATAAAVVQSYSNPNVVFYLCDDYGDNTCTTVINWATTNGIVCNSIFCTPDIDMTDYGTVGMPKTVVVGGPDHAIFFNKNGTVQTSFLEDAIDDALATNLGVNENPATGLKMTVFPNPASNYLTVNFTMGSAADVSIDFVNLLGEIVTSVSLGNQLSGNQQYNLYLESLTNGFYFVNLKTGNYTATVKLHILH